MTPDDIRARNRFVVLQLIRLTGVGLALTGLLVIAGRIGWPREVGYAFVLVGLFDALIAPILLTRGWKSPKP